MPFCCPFYRRNILPAPIISGAICSYDKITMFYYLKIFKCDFPVVSGFAALKLFITFEMILSP